MSGYQVLKNDLPIFTVNCFLEAKCRMSSNTGKQYAYRICKYLNYLQEVRKVDHKEATKKDVAKFLDTLLFESEGLVYIDKSRVAYNTVSMYLTVIKEFYRYLEDELHESTNIKLDRVKGNSKGRYLYGQLWSFDTKNFLNGRIKSMKGSKEYIKWYSDEEIEALLDNFITQRDKAIFLLSLEGLRIDEILSLRVCDFDATECTVTPYRSKGKETGNVASVVVITNECQEAISNYMYCERDEVIMSLEEKCEELEYPNELFLNLKQGPFMGKAVTYRNILDIFKKTAERANIDPKKIRTHSGRSTKTMNLLYYQNENPEKLSDEKIREIMRWSSPNSIKSYINTKDKRLALDAAKKISKMNKKKVEDE